MGKTLDYYGEQYMELNFRSALRGFNRQDVAHYLEYLNNQHAVQVNQLNTDLEALRRQLDPQPDTAMEQRVRELEERCQALEEKAAALEAERDAAVQAREEALKEAQVRATGSKLDTSLELEAYRRAERAERVARERANLVYAQTGTVLNQASARVEGAIRQVTGISQQLSGQLDTLQTAISASRLALQDAAETIQKLKPRQD